jgi:hypothetical protein
MVPWVSPPLAVLLFACLAIFLIASYWWRTRPSNTRAEAATLFRRYASLWVLMIPALVLIGFFLLLFPVGIPESVVLRSRAALLPMRPLDKTCFEHAFAQLKSSGPRGDLAECDTADLQLGERIVDAGPLVDRALDTFGAESKFTLEQVRQKEPEVLNALKRAVSLALTMNPPVIESPPPVPRGALANRRWVTEAIEIAVLEGLTLRRNVRNIIVERHLTDFDDARSDPWRTLLTRVENQVIAHRPAVRIENGSKRGAQAYISVVGQPWIRRRGDHGELFAMVLKGPEASAATFSVVNGDNKILLSCDDQPAGPSVPLGVCAPDFDALEPGTMQLLSIRVATAIDDGPYSLRLAIDKSGETTSTKVIDAADVTPVYIGATGPVRATLSCLLTDATSPSSKAFRQLLMDGNRQPVELAASLPADVAVKADKEGIWVIPGDARPGLLEEIAGSQLWPEDAFLGGSEKSGRHTGLMLFPYIARADGSSPSTGASTEAPLRTRRSTPYSDPTLDPALGVQPPRTLWIDRADARAVAFSYARENYTYWADRIFPTSYSPIAWRVDVPAGRIDGRVATVWRYAVDFEDQGLLLQFGCRPTTTQPDITKIPHGSEVSTYEPKYEAGRFFPLWAAVISAARTTASPDAELAFSAQGKAVVPAILLDETLRSQIRMRSAELGLQLILAGLLIHSALMIWFRYRSIRAW